MPMIFKKFSPFSHRISASVDYSPTGGMIKARSYDSLDKLTGCFANMNKEVDNLLVTCEEDLREAPQLMRLVSDFYNSSDKLSSLCDSLKMCLTKAHSGESLIANALRDFEEEKRVSGDDGSFRKTLQDLKCFADYSEDPFLVEFAENFRDFEGDLIKSINEIHVTLKELRRICRRMRIAITLLAVVAAPLLACVAVAGAVIPPAVARVIREAVSNAPVALGVSTWWRKSRDKLKKQKNATKSMERGTCVAVNEVKKIRKLVDELKKLLESMGETAETGAERRSPVNEVMREVEEKLKSFKSTIGNLGEEAERCGEDVEKSRNLVRNFVTEFLTRPKQSTN